MKSVISTTLTVAVSNKSGEPELRGIGKPRRLPTRFEEILSDECALVWEIACEDYCPGIFCGSTNSDWSALGVQLRDIVLSSSVLSSTAIQDHVDTTQDISINCKFAVGR